MENFQTYIGELPQAYRDEVRQILFDCDEEFYPPLSKRNSPYQTALLSPSSQKQLPFAYFDELEKQKFILLISDGQVSAFLSYKEKKEEREFYVSTLCVKEAFRGRGLLHLLYDSLEERALLEDVSEIATRTWSTNEAQIKTLRKHGYEISKVIPNDRPNGVDTLYFKKLLSTHK